MFWALSLEIHTPFKRGIFISDAFHQNTSPCTNSWLLKSDLMPYCRETIQISGSKFHTNSHWNVLSKQVLIKWMHFLSKWVHALSLEELQQITDMLYVRENAEKFLIVTDVYIFMLLYLECTSR